MQYTQNVHNLLGFSKVVMLFYPLPSVQFYHLLLAVFQVEGDIRDWLSSGDTLRGYSH